jgi:hypothetical protein
MRRTLTTGVFSERIDIWRQAVVERLGDLAFHDDEADGLANASAT